MELQTRLTRFQLPLTRAEAAAVGTHPAEAVAVVRAPARVPDVHALAPEEEDDR